ncbi:hypothetical protein [Caulobacter sp. LjRoot300]|uniref:hypothetical protein n=1 Tax=Caulobacter sp. LjRoot300 TaxID=3342321 RepID=UPI003ECD7D1E
MEFFVAFQRHAPLGHAFFRTVKDENSLKRLWDTQLQHFVKRRFRFDDATLKDVEALWGTCISSVEALAVAEAPLVEGSAEPAVQPGAAQTAPAPEA